MDDLLPVALKNIIKLTNYNKNDIIKKFNIKKIKL